MWNMTGLKLSGGEESEARVLSGEKTSRQSIY
jgi:hypothetical protein